VEANSTGGQGSRRAVAPSDDTSAHSDRKVADTPLFGCPCVCILRPHVGTRKSLDRSFTVDRLRFWIK
jgi:hypothetical protein